MQKGGDTEKEKMPMLKLDVIIQESLKQDMSVDGRSDKQHFVGQKEIKDKINEEVHLLGKIVGTSPIQKIQTARNTFKVTPSTLYAA